MCLLATTPTLAAPASTLSAAAKTTSSPALGSPLKAEDRAAMLAFDAVYIPALFLTGSAGKSAEGPGQARAAMPRRPPKLPHLWPLKLLHLAGVN